MTVEEDIRMAGRRRGTQRPRQEMLRNQRRLERLHDELRQARTPRDQLAAAYDFLRGALKHTDPATAADICSEMTQLLSDAGRRALNNRSKETR